MTSTKTTKDKVKTKVHSQDSIPSFIRKTYDILEERKFPDVIDWNPEGTALVIKKPSDFCQKVLPAYFKHNNLTSFVRQLNMYNFHKRRTQNIDHVYYHELFQKGKKHMLKEIKRKNHDHGSDKTQKNIENIEPSQSGKDINTLLYENQVLRRLYNDASTKVAVLEGQVRDLTNQNQTLWSQLCSQGDRDMSAFKPLMARVEKNASLTQDQLPMTFGDISIPPLKLEADRQGSIQPALPLAKVGGNVNNYLNLSEASADSTDASHNSPSTQNTTEVDKNLTITSNASTTLQLPQIALNPSLSTLQIKPMISDLFVSRQDMSVGQLFEAWNQEAQSTELICFADQQKNDRNIINVQALFQDPMNMLGKRMFDSEQQGNFADPRFNVPEPLMKRQDLSIFNRRNMISTGTEDKEFLKALIRRESSINEEFDPNNMGVDLMDFNQPFINSTKASS